MPVKVKLSADREVEVPDELAPLVADETGVPYKNRAAEFRRKLERLERRLEALEAEEEEKASKDAKAEKAPATQSATAPAGQASTYAPGWYTDPSGAYYYFDGAQWYALNTGRAANVGATVMTPGVPSGGNGNGAASTPNVAEAAKAAAKEVLAEAEAEAREAEEYERLRAEWPGIDDEDEVEKLNDYLLKQGYSEKEIEQMSAKALRLAVRAWRAEQGAEGKPVVLSTGAPEVPSEPLFRDPNKIRSLPRDRFNELIERVKMRSTEV